VWYGEEYAVELGIALQDDEDEITAEGMNVWMILIVLIDTQNTKCSFSMMIFMNILLILSYPLNKIRFLVSWRNAFRFVHVHTVI
jgi:hypothetical protein